MSDLIDRDALMARFEKDCMICKWKRMDREYGGCSFCGMTSAIGEVKRAPAVSVPPVWHSVNETPALNTEEVIAIHCEGEIFHVDTKATCTIKANSGIGKTTTTKILSAF